MTPHEFLRVLVDSIAERLQSGEPVGLPGIGSLHAGSPAGDGSDGYPRVHFVEGSATEQNDAVLRLATSVGHRSGHDVVGATNGLHRFARSLRQSLDETGNVEIPGIGVFEKTPGGLVFHPAAELDEVVAWQHPAPPAASGVRESETARPSAEPPNPVSAPPGDASPSLPPPDDEDLEYAPRPAAFSAAHPEEPVDPGVTTSGEGGIPRADELPVSAPESVLHPAPGTTAATEPIRHPAPGSAATPEPTGQSSHVDVRPPPSAAHPISDAGAKPREKSARSRRPVRGSAGSGSDRGNLRTPLLLFAFLALVVVVVAVMIGNRRVVPAVEQVGETSDSSNVTVIQSDSSAAETPGTVPGTRDPVAPAPGTDIEADRPPSSSATAQQPVASQPATDGSSRPPVPPAYVAGDFDTTRAGYTLVASSTPDVTVATRYANSLRELGYPVAVLAYTDGGAPRFRVGVGVFPTPAAADSVRRVLENRLPDGTWVRRIRP